MRSRFFGAKGDAVKLIQRQLNRVGAKIAEDGIWGDETEDAYDRLSEGLLGAEDQTDNNAEKADGVQPAPLNEYDQDLQYARDKAKRLTDAVQTALGRLDPEYKARQDALERTYTSRKRDMEGTTLSKGMGRSSHAADIREEEYEQWRSDQAALLEDKKQKLEDLNADIASIQASLAETETKINRKKQEAEQKASRRTRGGGGRSSSGKKMTAEQKKQWELDVLQNWYKMSISSKIHFFERSWEEIYRQSPKVARQMAQDLERATGRQYIIN